MVENKIVTGTDESGPPGPKSGLASFLSCMKIFIIVTLVIYLWSVSANRRYNDLRLLQTLVAKD